MSNPTRDVVRIAIFGAGPAGFYAAEEWLKQTDRSVEVSSPALCSGSEVMRTLLTHEGVRYVTFTDWQSIDKVEIANGQQVGKPREKLTTISTLLSAIQENS